MIQVDDKALCCGCSGCANACPCGCIQMLPDEEGFLYPTVDGKSCIGCGMCEKVCPVIHVQPEVPSEQNGYLVQNLNEQIRAQSTSGGAFSAIAEYILEKGGVVFGAAFDEALTVKHRWVDNVDELSRFRNSKYVQSEIGETFRQAKGFLDAGRWVCFSGTPCQIEGLLLYLGSTYNNLITVDVVCRAVPSPLVLKKYLQWQAKKQNREVANAAFRDKGRFGYCYSMMRVAFKGASSFVAQRGVESDPMLRAFFSNVCDRPSCYSCVFKKRYRVCDLTIWDCLEPSRFSREIDDNKGTTRVLTHTEKGIQILEAIKSSIRSVEANPDLLTKDVREMFKPVIMNPRRERFMKDCASMPSENLWETYFPDTIRIKAERITRAMLARMGVYHGGKALAKYIISKIRPDKEMQNVSG